MTESTEFWLNREDLAMDGCRNLAWNLYQADGILSHERIAYDLGQFLYARIGEQPETPERAALLSVVRTATRVATYLSSGAKAIRMSLATLLRLAAAYREHPDFRPAWDTTKSEPR